MSVNGEGWFTYQKESDPFVCCFRCQSTDNVENDYYGLCFSQLMMIKLIENKLKTNVEDEGERGRKKYSSRLSGKNILFFEE